MIGYVKCVLAFLGSYLKDIGWVALAALIAHRRGADRRRVYRMVGSRCGGGVYCRIPGLFGRSGHRLGRLGGDRNYLRGDYLRIIAP